MSKVGSILEGLQYSRVYESENDDLSMVEDLERSILNKYPKLAKCSFRIYGGYSKDVDIFIGGKTNIIGCDDISIKKLRKEQDPIKFCIDALKVSVDKRLFEVGTNSYADRSLPLIKKFYDAIGEKLDIADKELTKKKVRFSDENALKKYIGTICPIIEDFGQWFVVEYPKGAKSLRSDLKKRIVDMGYSVDSYKNILDIEINKKGLLLSATIYDDDETDDGVVVELTLVY